jgi:hypothetical protein
MPNVKVFFLFPENKIIFLFYQFLFTYKHKHVCFISNLESRKNINLNIKMFINEGKNPKGIQNSNYKKKNSY